MFTANLDGTDLREVVPWGKGVSHFDWRSPTEIIATYRLNGPSAQHVLFTDGADDHREVGAGFIVGDGHCTFSPDGQWFVTDPRTGLLPERSLRVFNVETNEGHVLGTFPLGEFSSGDLRCDLHPRWHPSGKVICFDAIEKGGTRQVHFAKIEW